MAWQRKIPFGYQMTGGELKCCPAEQKTVIDIFHLYAEGLAYSGIAQEMMRRGIGYHKHTPVWNKNMVKRILENEVYLGEKGYPQIVSQESYLTVQLMKGNKIVFNPSPDYIQPIRSKSVCGVCGGRMLRDTRCAGKPRWYCENEGCSNRHYIEDANTHAAITSLLGQVLQNPSLLDCPKPQRNDEITLEAARIQSEVIRELNKVQPSPDYTKTLILARAAEQYAALPDYTAYHRAAQLKERILSAPTDKTLQDELLTDMTETIEWSATGSLALRLTNGTLLTADRKEG
ncbi:MAG: recombinase family protein [Oscillospiraceae bacterium]|nr:recombinase family protein [Oscillospiraceae bacterium]HBR01492.1 recombinase [Ruminiclostridium sp.]